jgi:hypothetical protein
VDREYLLRRHDEELAKASTATSDVAKQAYQSLALAFLDAANRTDDAKVIPFPCMSLPTDLR